MERETSFVWMRCCWDVASILLVTAVVVYYNLWGVPEERGFFCDDESIRYPVLDDTFPELPTFSLVLSGSLITLVLIEMAVKGCHARSPFSVRGWLPPLWLDGAYRLSGIFILGALFCQLMMDVGKIQIGRLRPHFLAVCRPDVISYCDVNVTRHQYVTQYTCTNLDLSAVRRSRTSFPSAHASLVFYSATFLILYLQRTLTWRWSTLLRPTLQVSLALSAMFVSITRIRDNMHHWSDVVVGGSIGTITALLMVLFVSDLYSRDVNQDSLETEPLNTEPTHLYMSVPLREN